MSTATLEKVQAEKEQAIDANRDLGVIQYKSSAKQSDAIYEIVEGKHRLPDGRVLGPGQRFHPLERQVTGGKNGRGTLYGKAREISRSEYRSVRSNRISVAGSDIGVRALPMADGTKRMALAAGLTDEDFRGIEPANDGQYTRKQVEEIIAAKSGQASE